MHERTIWRSRLDGRTHRAIVTGNDHLGYEVTSDCGLSSKTSWGEEIDLPLEITCPVCRIKSGANVVVTARAA